MGTFLAIVAIAGLAFLSWASAKQKTVANSAFLARVTSAQEWINSTEEIPPVNPGGVVMQKGEVCYYVGEARWSELRTRTDRVTYSGPVASIKIAKGLRYRIGSATVQAHKVTELRQIDQGMLYITSKRLFFEGAEKNTTIAYKAISQLKVFNGGFEVEKQAGKSPVLHLSHDAERAAAIAMRAQMESANG
ncbi:MAG: hypothetical protein ABIZ70_07245 [Gemmatimonadales bacterium]